ncbi:SDR family oxidoreductase [Rhizobium rhizogenes]|uniref:SDR family oxidoreductase n=1 Tax=Rhizobium rhizogenes TaxID=359 RepID=UPI0015745C0E|nr:SDR family oxidoreductase [Rhizobium rhizogenes]NTF45742.1 SDR family oxidoreductase [Rhizobium rhizogenes]
MSYTIAIFGASGAIGRSLCNWHLERQCSVVGIARHIDADADPRIHWVKWDPCHEPMPDAKLGLAPIDAVIWAQGMNLNDNARSFDAELHRRVYDANVVYILASLKALLDSDLLSKTARLVVISSIWQNIARSNKLSYGVTKSALLGLVQSLSLDLGAEGKLVNAVLPGALDTPMTRANLSAEQIGRLEGMTPLGSLPALSDVCNLAGFLCSPENTGVTGQFIAADRGFSHAKIL